MTYGRCPNLEKFRYHERAPRPVSMASTGTPGPHTSLEHPGQLSQRLSEAQSTSWLRKLHRSASGPRPQGSTSCSRSIRFPATTIGCVMRHTYDDMYERDPRQSASRSLSTGSFRQKERQNVENCFFLKEPPFSPFSFGRFSGPNSNHSQAKWLVIEVCF